MKKFLFGLLMVALATPAAWSQITKMDICGQVLYENYKEKMAAINQGQPVPAHLNSVEVPESLTVTVRFGSANDLSKAEALGIEVLSEAGNMAVVTVPMAKLEEFCNLEEVKAVQSPRKVKLLNNLARVASRVNEVRSGLKDKDGNPVPGVFNGTGVVVGLMDTGLDPNHINFKDADGNTRVKGITKYSSVGGTARASDYTTESQIANFTTEDNTETHGTHVLGIITGAYNPGTDYSGMAPNADIWVCCGDLSDPCILAAVDKIAGYADGEGKPAVINLSLGVNFGSHDKYDSFNQYLDNLVTKYSNPPIITISSGNEGDTRIALRRELTASQTSFATCVPVTSYYYNSSYGYDIEFYGSDSSIFSITPFIYDKSSKQEVLQMTAIKINSNLNGSMKNMSASSTALGDYGTGYVRGTSRIDSQSKRFYITYHGTFDPSDSKYYLGFRVEGTAGQTLYCYATDYDGVVEFTNASSANYINGTYDGTINSMCCGEHTLSIGSYNTRKQWTSTSGSTYSSGSTVNAISSFTSWGNLWDGRLLPHVCAPGSMIVSSISKYNAEYSGSNASYYKFPTSDTVVKTTVNGRTQYWGVMQGTSMSSPHAAGVFALWKQLKPDLTPAQCVEAAQATAKTDSYTTSAGGKAGAGKLDAYAGMQYILENFSGVESLISRNLPTVLVREVARGEFEIATAEGDAFTATLYGVSGQVAAKVAGEGNAMLNTNNLPKGVYVLSVNGRKVNGSQKIVVR